MNVPLLDLTAQYESIRAEIEPAVLELFAKQQFVLGPPVEHFEQHLAEYCRCDHAVGVSSGTDALLCCLMALDIKHGDEVIVPTFTFFGSAGAIARTGATPVFVDINPDNFNLDIDWLESAVTGRTRAVMPVHLFGQMAPMKSILMFARRHGLAVIEDACQSIGARQDDLFPGRQSDAACLSFYPSKNLSGCGDGGAILCSNNEFARKCRYLRMHGEDRRYYHSMIGGNFRLDALQAVVLDIKMKHLDRWVQARRRHAAIYDDRLCDEAKTPVIDPGNFSVYNQYVIRALCRDELKDYLQAHGIGSAIYYPVPLHLQKCFEYLGREKGECPVAERICGEVLAIPVYPELSDDQIHYVAETINAFYR